MRKKNGMAGHTAWQGREWLFVISPFFSNKGMGGGRGVGRRNPGNWRSMQGIAEEERNVRSEGSYFVATVAI